MKSSYKKNNYGDLFTSLVKIHKPSICVEYGLLDGYSTIHIAEGLKQNSKGHLFSFDIFEDFEFNHANYDNIVNNVSLFELDNFVTIDKGNFYDPFEFRKFKINSIDFMHVDVANTGETIDCFCKSWWKRISFGGIVVFEGGSILRDSEIEWMKNKKPISNFNKIIGQFFNYTVINSYPSITLLTKKLPQNSDKYEELAEEYRSH